ncbi:putative alpha-E superfamily protein [Sphingomonas jejuensis]|uniref:Alpha-E superfamily protein n=1 Tax=Sphingomonas jejuensis TaxID=904715 RepID=A0ABX0XKX0_9SPHN|nr:alpha-E domain-containing protein [Sphingomonas jejuensis]NJC34003.1 putative alpha-E superfamily protein [Sphingomonas jejuensis]
MLSRAASNLFWLGRYMERADFVVRLLDATLRLAALPSSHDDAAEVWTSALKAAGADGWKTADGELDEDATLQHMALAGDNPSSIRSCLERARANARAVRTALTIDAWEAINAAYHDVQKLRDQPATRASAGAILDMVKRSLHALDGALHRSMLRSDSLWFIRLGAAIERADNTARILEVKYHLLLPSDERVGGGLDHFQWATILRTVSALTAYRWIYRQSVKPWLVADLLIMQRQAPRSLIASYGDAVRHLDLLAAESGRRGPADRIGHATLDWLESSKTERIFADGLHEFLQRFLAENHRLGRAVAEQYLF